MKPHLLKAERERHGWSLVKFAELLGTTTRTVSRWEQGLVIPYPYYREQLCMLYEKTAEELGLLPDDCDIVRAPADAIKMHSVPIQPSRVGERMHFRVPTYQYVAPETTSPISQDVMLIALVLR